MDFDVQFVEKIINMLLEYNSRPQLDVISIKLNHLEHLLNSFKPHVLENVVLQILNGKDLHSFDVCDVKMKDEETIGFSFIPSVNKDEKIEMHSLDFILFSDADDETNVQSLLRGRFKFAVFERNRKKCRGVLQFIDSGKSRELDAFSIFNMIKADGQVTRLTNLTPVLRVIASLNSDELHEPSPVLRIILANGKLGSFSPFHPSAMKFLQQDVQYTCLNENQQKVTSHVIQAMRYSSDLTLLQGPPGTGKTATLCVMVFNAFRILNKSARIIVCAPSNSAVARDANKFIHTYCIDDHPKINLLDVAILGRDDKMIQGNMLSKESQSRYFGENDSRKWKNEKSSVSIIFCTVSCTMSPRVKLLPFQHVYCDEAGQVAESETWMLVQPKVKQLVLIGDPCQLPPFSNIENSKELNSHRTMFERLWQLNHPCKVMLTTQYRMDPGISSMVSKLMYDNKLKNGHNVMEYTFDFKYPYKNVQFINVNGQEEQLATSTSFVNAEEADCVVGIVENIIASYADIARNALHFKAPSIGIITGYLDQKERIKSLCNAFKDQDVQIDTVDSFQGQEKDVIILSLVRTRRLGFTADLNRVNVAISRARKSLILVGKKTFFQHKSPWHTLVAQAGTHQRDIPVAGHCFKEYDDEDFVELPRKFKEKLTLDDNVAQRQKSHAYNKIIKVPVLEVGDLVLVGMMKTVSKKIKNKTTNQTLEELVKLFMTLIKEQFDNYYSGKEYVLGTKIKKAIERHMALAYKRKEMDIAKLLIKY